MALHYLIDGYNLLYALPEMPPGTWEQKREALLLKIGTERPQRKNKITVVFDSRQGLGDRTRRGEVEIVFTAGETADDWISDHVREVPNPRTVIVVTDDQGLRRLVRGTGARGIGAREFWKQAEAPRPKALENLDSGIQNEINEEMRKKWL